MHSVELLPAMLQNRPLRAPSGDKRPEDRKMSDKIFVAVRFRPLNERELREQQELRWSVVENTIHRNDVHDRASSKSFTFDRVFQEDTETRDIYEAVAAPIVADVMEGINGSILAYGQTSSGKTHTMMGSGGKGGIMGMAIDQIFNTIDERAQTHNFWFRVSCLEIYNENVSDLLDPTKTNLKVSSNEDKVDIKDLTQYNPSSPEELFETLQAAMDSRHTASTKMNEHSSRSHTIFRLEIQSAEIGNSTMATRTATLNLVDLAGSERVSHTGAEGDRLKEAGNINSSLLHLGTVIQRLAENPGKAVHVPYRNSSLTLILKNSLGGNSRTAMICAVTPAAQHTEETLSTLQFANRAKKIQNHAVVNETFDNELQAAYQRKAEEVVAAQQELDAVKHKYRMLQEELSIVRAEAVVIAQRASQVPVTVRRRETCCPAILSREVRLSDGMEQPVARLSDISRRGSPTAVCFDRGAGFTPEKEVAGEPDSNAKEFAFETDVPFFDSLTQLQNELQARNREFNDLKAHCLEQTAMLQEQAACSSCATSAAAMDDLRAQLAGLKMAAVCSVTTPEKVDLQGSAKDAADGHTQETATAELREVHAKEVARLKDNIDFMRTELEVLREVETSSAADQAQHEDTAAYYEGIIQKLEEKLKTKVPLKPAMEALSCTDCPQLRQQIEGLEAEMRSSHDTAARLETNLIHTKEELVLVKTELQDARYRQCTACPKWQQQLGTVQTQLQGVQEQLVLQQQEQSVLQTGHDKARQQHQDSLQQALATQTELKATIAQLKERLQQQSEENVDLQKQLHSASATHLDNASMQEELKAQLTAADQRLVAVTSELTLANTTIAQLQQALLAAVQNQEETANALAVQQSTIPPAASVPDHTECDEINKTLRGQLVVLRRELAFAQDQVHNASSAALELQLETAGQQVAEAMAETTALQTQCQTLEQQVGELQTNLTQEQQHRVELERTIAMLEQQLEDLRQRSEADLQQLAMEAEQHITATVAKLQEDMTQLELRHCQHVQDLESQLNQMQLRCLELETDKAALEQDNSQQVVLAARLQEMTETNAACTQELQQLQQEKQELEAETARLRCLEQGWSTQVENAQKQVAHVHIQLQQQQQATEREQAKVEDMAAELAAYQQNESSWISQIEELCAQVARGEADSTQLQAQVSALSIEMQSQAQANEGLESELMDAEKALRDLQVKSMQQRNTLEQKNKDLQQQQQQERQHASHAEITIQEKLLAERSRWNKDFELRIQEQAQQFAAQMQQLNNQLNSKNVAILNLEAALERAKVELKELRSKSKAGVSSSGIVEDAIKEELFAHNRRLTRQLKAQIPAVNAPVQQPAQLVMDSLPVPVMALSEPDKPAPKTPVPSAKSVNSSGPRHALGSIDVNAETPKLKPKMTLLHKQDTPSIKLQDAWDQKPGARARSRLTAGCETDDDKPTECAQQ